MRLFEILHEDQNTIRQYQQIISKFPAQLQREFTTERPNPDQEDIEWAAGLKLLNNQPVLILTTKLLQKQENLDNISRTPPNVVGAINKKWNLHVQVGAQYDPNPDRYIQYANMPAATAQPSVMVNGEIVWGIGRFIATLLRGDKSIRVWSLSAK